MTVELECDSLFIFQTGKMEKYRIIDVRNTYLKYRLNSSLIEKDKTTVNLYTFRGCRDAKR